MDIYAQSHIGMVREENQDTYCVTAVREGVTLAVVCDGMGGAAGGKLAASLACEEFVSRFCDSYASLVGEALPTEELLHRVYSHAIYHANNAVFEESITDPTLHGMGTTLTAACVAGGGVYTANVGDSRTYLFRAGGIEQLTHDDSLVQLLLDRGKISGSEAESGIKKNILIRALGTDPYVEFGFRFTPLFSESSLLLCSDGLTAYYDEAALSAALRPQRPARTVVEELIGGALAAGGQDNVTCVYLRDV